MPNLPEGNGHTGPRKTRGRPPKHLRTGRPFGRGRLLQDPDSLVEDLELMTGVLNKAGVHPISFPEATKQNVAAVVQALLHDDNPRARIAASRFVLATDKHKLAWMKFLSESQRDQPAVQVNAIGETIKIQIDPD